MGDSFSYVDDPLLSPMFIFIIFIIFIRDTTMLKCQENHL